MRARRFRPTLRGWQYLEIPDLGDSVGIRVAVEVNKATMRERAIKFAVDHANDTSEQGQRQTFWYEFYEVFGGSVRQVGMFEKLAKRITTGNVGWIDLLHPGEMAVEHKSAGGDLSAAMHQLLDYTPSLEFAELPWLLVVCDFRRFVWHNLETQESGEFLLAELPDHVALFSWIGGYNRPGEQFENEEDANLKATELLASVHDQLAETGYSEHALRKWITRILFCLFADDTRIWERNALHAFLAFRTKSDGSDLGPTLTYIFEILDTPPEERSKALDTDLVEFTYVNGDLFGEQLPTPSCTQGIRDALLAACRFNWAAISPAIFGSLFQNVMTSKERRNLGAHYTTEKNILRTIGPLFLDELKFELSGATTRKALTEFHAKLAELTFFDPACGCGNFLVVAYREMRALETECLQRLNQKEKRLGQRTMNLELLCRVNVAQFYGIELEEFPALIAQTALYLADHLANREVSLEFGEQFLRFPIPSAPNIAIGNALRIDWAEVLSPERANFVFGNPPFVGRQYRSPEQKADMDFVFAGARGHAVLDFVASWFAKAAGYIGTETRVAFVATNSISQGENVGVLWPILEKFDIKYDFAYRPFAWESDARGKARVHCVIIGFSRQDAACHDRAIYEDSAVPDEPVKIIAKNISPYLNDGPSIVAVPRRSGPLADWVPPAQYGAMANDGGHLLFDDETIAVARSDSTAAKYVRQYIGGTELLNSGNRWALWLANVSPSEIASSPLLKSRLEATRAYRLASKRATTVAAAMTPALFAEMRESKDEFLLVPYVSSENRPIVPMAFYPAQTLVRAPSWCIPRASVALFGVLQSAMFMAWVRTVGGRLESRFQLSPGTIYNTFPFPELSTRTENRISDAAQAVLDARGKFSDTALGMLYAPTSMSAELVKTHRALDKAVDAAYGRHKHDGDASRLAVLFRRYVQLTGGDAELFGSV